MPENHELTIDTPFELAGGITVTLAASGHRHNAGGGTTSMFELQVRRGDEESALLYRFSDDDPRWHLEHVAFGQLFVVTPVLPDDHPRRHLTTPEEQDQNMLRRLRVTPFSGTVARKADEERALELARTRVKGHDGAAQGWHVTSGNVLVFRVFASLGARRELGHVEVGIYSGEVLLQRP